MRHAIPKREWLLCRMQKLSQNCMVSSQKLQSICQGNMNHSLPHNPRYQSSPRLEGENLPCSLSLNQVHLLFALRLFYSQVRQLIQSIEIGTRRGHDDVCISPMP